MKAISYVTTNTISPIQQCGQTISDNTLFGHMHPYVGDVFPERTWIGDVPPIQVAPWEIVPLPWTPYDPAPFPGPQVDRVLPWIPQVPMAPPAAMTPEQDQNVKEILRLMKEKENCSLWRVKVDEDDANMTWLFTDVPGVREDDLEVSIVDDHVINVRGKRFDTGIEIVRNYDMGPGFRVKDADAAYEAGVVSIYVIRATQSKKRLTVTQK